MSNGYNDHDPAQVYLAPLKSYQQLMQAREGYEGTLLNAYVELIEKYRQKCAECDREQRNATVWEKEHRLAERELQRAERELQTIKSSAESSQFAYVIIDGDGAVFREELISQGEQGGITAAHELHSEIENYLKDTYSLSQLDLYVQVILSIEGLSKALFNSGTLKNTDERNILSKFARGFNSASPFFSFVDVKYGKERADNRVRKVFETMERMPQCRAIILGGCHDNGYATFLESFRRSRKVSLLETTPAAADFRHLPFQRVSFHSIFRSESLMSRPMAPPPGFGILSHQQNQPSLSSSAPSKSSPTTSYAIPASVKPPSPAGAQKESNGQPGSWASVGRAGNTPQVIDISSQKKSAKSEPWYLQLNKDDERIDVPLPKLDNNAKESFDQKTRGNGANFCNKFYLQGNCKAMDATGHCPYIHNDRLSPAELLILKYRARGLPCAAGSQCRDIRCTSGHHCPNPNSCYFDDKCRFVDTHGLDITPTIKIFEDGTREIVP
ncbi:hypothetical protein QBC34DRAFT_185040 [Podospora aff. communis PSN243]|uniref:C3H1-type domain-containing protein n=1 Tax=Podospora aff. communis PSN243 TaxID=3040156 RepID=A0AAV9G870_9PEZI|nr:hypothetical protein QBC34DRAFT_185040 [Podospora aff. communis PSN243]